MKGGQSGRWSGWRTLSSSLRTRPDGEKTALTAWQWCMKCFSMQQPKGGKRQNGQFTEATGRSCLSWTHRQVYPPFHWWDQKPQKKNCRNYTWRSTNYTDFQGLLLGNQHYWKRWCPPSKTAKGRGKRGHPQPQQGPSQQTPNPQEAEPPRREEGTAQWRGVWPPYVRPTKKCWPWQLPLRKKLKDWATPGPTQKWKRGLKAGTAGDIVGRNKRGGAIRCSLKTILPPTAHLAWGESPVKKQPPLKVQIWKIYWS